MLASLHVSLIEARHVGSLPGWHPFGSPQDAAFRTLPFKKGDVGLLIEGPSWRNAVELQEMHVLLHGELITLHCAPISLTRSFRIHPTDPR